MSLCPKAVVTSKPKRERWALEEIWDTVFEIDYTCKVYETKFKGVYIIETKADPVTLAKAFMRYTHAFISTVIPSTTCIKISESERLLELLGSIIERTLSNMKVKILLRLRGRSKNLVESLTRSLSKFNIVETPQYNHTFLVIDGVDDLIFISKGVFHSCGPRCYVLFPIEECLNH
jgi:hypothetical protein